MNIFIQKKRPTTMLSKKPLGPQKAAVAVKEKKKEEEETAPAAAPEAAAPAPCMFT